MTTRTAIEQLFRSNYAAMLILAGRLMHDEDAARDIVHDIFAALLSSGNAGVTSAYLMKAVKNRCVNRIRDLSVRDRLQELYALDSDHDNGDDWPDEATITQLNELIDSSLTESCRKVVTLRFTDGLSYHEISETLGISEVAVYKHLRHEIDVLRQKLKKDE